MPGMKYITIPEPVTLLDPQTGNRVKEKDGELQKPVEFKDLLYKLMFHPQWNENYNNIASAAAINQAFKEAKDGVMVLSDEDWTKLKKTIDEPKIVAVDQFGQHHVQLGLGWHPIMTPQLLPLLKAIAKATDTAPVKKEDQPTPLPVPATKHASAV